MTFRTHREQYEKITLYCEYVLVLLIFESRRTGKVLWLNNMKNFRHFIPSEFFMNVMSNYCSFFHFPKFVIFLSFIECILMKS
jgi:hypothetical protein